MIPLGYLLNISSGFGQSCKFLFSHFCFSIAFHWRYVHTCAVRTRAGAGGKLASTQIIACVHTYAVTERRRSGSKIRPQQKGPTPNFPRPPRNHALQTIISFQEIADPPASAPRMCEYTRGGGARMSKSVRLRFATAPRMCERSFSVCGFIAITLNGLKFGMLVYHDHFKTD